MKKQLFFICTFFVLILGCETNPVLPFNIGVNFIPCGWIECGKFKTQYIQLQTKYQDNHRSDGTCFKVDFNFTNCPKKEGGIYWVNKKNGEICNFGDYPGEDFSKKGYTQLTVSLRGETGGERIKILTGEIDEPNKLYKDGEKASKFVTLSNKWDTIHLDISQRSLESVINGFGWYATSGDNPDGATFYIDDIYLD